MEDTRYSRRSSRIRDPYTFLALNVILQALKDIECYFYHYGRRDEIKEGKNSIRWIRKMEGNFRILAGASGWPIDNFHQKCIEKINEIKRSAYERQAMETKNRTGKGSGKGDTQVVQAKQRPRSVFGNFQM